MLRRAALAVASASISFSALASTTTAGVILVDSNGFGDFTTLQEAVEAAQDGDTILVRGGEYSGFTAPDKSLTLVADTDAVVEITGRTTISNLSASHTIVLGGLSMRGVQDFFWAEPALILEANAGPVRAQRCSFTGANIGPPYAYVGSRSGSGAGIGGSSTRAAFVDCVFRGGSGANCQSCGEGFDGGTGFEIGDDSRIALYDCVVHGGDGSSGVADSGGDGGDAAHVGWGFVHSSNSTLSGGNGGTACNWFPTHGGWGGDVLELYQPGAAWRVGSSFVPGAGGAEHHSSSCDGFASPDGQPVVGDGDLFDLPTDALLMSAPYLVREGADVPLTLRGQPGTEVFLLVSGETTFRALPSWRGVRIAGSTGRLHPMMLLGTIPASGVLTAGIRMGDLPSATAAETFFLQAWGRGPTGRVLGSFAALTILDSAY
jgi:hypothetical protein